MRPTDSFIKHDLLTYVTGFNKQRLFLWLNSVVYSTYVCLYLWGYVHHVCYSVSKLPPKTLYYKTMDECCSLPGQAEGWSKVQWRWKLQRKCRNTASYTQSCPAVSWGVHKLKRMRIISNVMYSTPTTAFAQLSKSGSCQTSSLPPLTLNRAAIWIDVAVWLEVVYDFLGEQ